MTLQQTTQHQLRQFVEQIERLADEKQGIMDDIKDKYTEMKAFGFDTKVVRQLIKLRKMSRDDRQYQDEVLHTYMHAIGMVSEDETV